jgi:MOSC domain-containing protein YiiM
MTLLSLPILGVSVGGPAPLGEWQGEGVMSAIRKTPVTHMSIALDALNLDGDGQADLSVHGGPDKAVYCYPSAHADWWLARGVTYRAGFMGENLTLDGADESTVRIGDQFRWGPALVEVSEPRGPCFKLGLLTGVAAAPALMTQSGTCGWYLRVIETGDVPVHGTLDRTHSDPAAPTVREAFLAKTRSDFPLARLQEIAAWPTLADTWRGSLLRAAARRHSGG